MGVYRAHLEETRLTAKACTVSLRRRLFPSKRRRARGEPVDRCDFPKKASKGGADSSKKPVLSEGESPIIGRKTYLGKSRRMKLSLERMGREQIDMVRFISRLGVEIVRRYRKEESSGAKHPPDFPDNPPLLRERDVF